MLARKLIVTACLALIAALALTTVAFGKSVTLRATMKGTSEVPAADKGASASAKIAINAATGKVCWSFTKKKGFSGATAAHIHTGKAGKNGAVVVPLGGKYKSSGCVTGIDKAALTSVLAKPGSFYVNIHTPKFPNGALRGQLH